ncbi:MAG: hypothetical protein AABZ60_19020 [Planctomycetota bacterium]
MKSFFAITLIWIGLIGTFHWFLSSPEIRFSMWLGAGVSYGILMPTYLFSLWMKRKSVEQASKVFYGGYVYRFVGLFAVLIGFDKYLKIPMNTFVPFLLFFYLLLLFLEAGILSYEFSVSVSPKEQKSNRSRPS